ncbi:MAG TPA: carboxylesterase family protein [Stellaceae bacterium]|nr:carboxylesterase family protein [Stellaceae bacterium]
MMTDPIRVTGGLVSGADADVDTGEGTVRVYKGIPFAAPPVGELRWREPQPVRPWSGTRACYYFGPVCQQPLVPRNAIMSLFSFDDPPECGMSEDCLYLNVWSGARSPDDRLPVIVWIFGGGHRVGGGSHPVSWGTNLAGRGAVVVAFNYRLGALGFLAHPALTKETGASGNYGAMDVIAALCWVRDNIAAFGGDPERVAIYGQSAGAAEVSVMMASKAAHGLFHRAIGGSGGRFNGGIMTAPMADLAAAEQRGKAFVEELDVRTLEEMRNLPADSLSAGRGQWGPIVDGRVLNRDVDAVFASGEQAAVPLITGFTSEEASPYPMLHMKDRAALENFARSNFGDAASTFLALYPAGDDEAAHAQSYRLRRDGTFAYQAWRWAELHAAAAKAPVFMYYFSHRVPLPAERRFREPVPPGGYGAWHGSELWYMFETLDTKPFPWQAQDRALARQMSEAMLAFARDGVPGAAWPEFVASDGQVAVLDDQIHAGALPNRAALEFFAARRRGIK